MPKMLPRTRARRQPRRLSLLLTLSVTGPLAFQPLAVFDAGRFGKVAVNGILNGFGMWRKHYVPADNSIDCRIGRHISLPDIGAQLAPNNYTYSHSLLYTFDCYTQTGLNTTTKLSGHWMVQAQPNFTLEHRHGVLVSVQKADSERQQNYSGNHRGVSRKSKS